MYFQLTKVGMSELRDEVAYRDVSRAKREVSNIQNMKHNLLQN